MVTNAPVVYVYRKYGTPLQEKKDQPRQNYANDPDMASAYQAVMDKVMGINEAARHSKVSKGSLISRVHDRMPLNAHVGKSTALTESEEMELAKCIKVLAD